MNYVYYVSTLKFVLHLHRGQILQFYVSTRRLRKKLSPLSKENKLAEDVTLLESIATVWIMVTSLIRLYSSDTPDDELPL